VIEKKPFEPPIRKKKIREEESKGGGGSRRGEANFTVAKITPEKEETL